MAKYHTNSWQWKRVQEILNEYWADEPDEYKVEVDMRFRKANGETQYKSICWVNPKYVSHDATSDIDDETWDKILPSFAEMDNWLACPHCGQRLTDIPWLIANEPEGYRGDAKTYIKREREMWERERPMFEDFEKQYVEHYKCSR